MVLQDNVNPVGHPAVLHAFVCNHGFGSVFVAVGGFAQPVYWQIDGPYHAVSYWSKVNAV